MNSVRIGTLKKAQLDFNKMPVGTILIPMSSFKRLDDSNAFVIDDELAPDEMGDFCFVEDTEDEVKKIYCKRSYGEKLLKESQLQEAQHQ